MGADIHIFPETRNKRWDKSSWNEISYGQFYGPRDYNLFGWLANVRGRRDFHERRGVPEDVSRTTFLAYHLAIADDEIADEYQEHDGVRYISEAYATELEERRGVKRIHRWHTEYIEDPDLHSASWMTLEEFKDALHMAKQSALEEYDDVGEDYPDVHYQALVAYLHTLESTGDYETRIVFWFDS